MRRTRAIASASRCSTKSARTISCGDPTSRIRTASGPIRRSISRASLATCPRRRGTKSFVATPPGCTVFAERAAGGGRTLTRASRLLQRAQEPRRFPSPANAAGEGQMQNPHPNPLPRLSGRGAVVFPPIFAMIPMTLIRRAARHLLPGGEGTSFIDSLDPRAGTPAPRYRKGKESGFLARQPRAGMTDKSLGRALLFVVSGRRAFVFPPIFAMIPMTLIRRAARHLLPGGEGTSFIDSLDPRAGTPAPRYRKG